MILWAYGPTGVAHAMEYDGEIVIPFVSLCRRLRRRYQECESSDTANGPVCVYCRSWAKHRVHRWAPVAGIEVPQ